MWRRVSATRNKVKCSYVVVEQTTEHAFSVNVPCLRYYFIKTIWLLYLADIFVSPLLNFPRGFRSCFRRRRTCCCFRLHRRPRRCFRRGHRLRRRRRCRSCCLFTSRRYLIADATFRGVSK